MFSRGFISVCGLSSAPTSTHTPAFTTAAAFDIERTNPEETLALLAPREPIDISDTPPIDFHDGNRFAWPSNLDSDLPDIDISGFLLGLAGTIGTTIEIPGPTD
ncbi:hypothetical protein FRB94_007877 [Tulasnella sp. JGI-2019a]|nr:hypothetical protein FRB94_007877 [Tulasnella sp. JGI-2019a]KAG9003590.1 hypothetical protein FRB93_011008 [Tulasnella sp. JGI-2019a]